MNDASITASHDPRRISSSSEPTGQTAAGPSSEHEPAAHPRVEEAKRLRRDQKVQFLDHLIRSIDIMTYCELTVLYYMDCSMIKFLVRALPHWLNFTPKPDIIPPIPPGQRPYVSTIFGTNLFCTLLHLIFAPPTAGEAMRGYLHGGLVIDFVGQSSPVSRWHLIGLDLLCLALQILILCAILEKQRILGTLDPAAHVPDQRQDHDAEEAGLMRSASMGAEAIEMQTLRSHEGDTAQDTLARTQGSEIEDEEVGDGHPLDDFGTGEYVAASFRVPDIVRTQWQLQHRDFDATTSTGAQNVAGIARRRWTATFRNSTMS